MLRSLLARFRSGFDLGNAGTQADSGTADDANPDADDPDADDPSGDGSEGGDTAEATNSVWDLIPGWQYDGRHVESGGMTRGEQEKAIRDVQRQAAEIERSENDSEPQADR